MKNFSNMRPLAAIVLFLSFGILGGCATGRPYSGVLGGGKQLRSEVTRTERDADEAKGLAGFFSNTFGGISSAFDPDAPSVVFGKREEKFMKEAQSAFGGVNPSVLFYEIEEAREQYGAGSLQEQQAWVKYWGTYAPWAAFELMRQDEACENGIAKAKGKGNIGSIDDVGSVRWYKAEQEKIRYLLSRLVDEIVRMNAIPQTSFGQFGSRWLQTTNFAAAEPDAALLQATVTSAYPHYVPARQPQQ